MNPNCYVIKYHIKYVFDEIVSQQTKNKKIQCNNLAGVNFVAYHNSQEWLTVVIICKYIITFIPLRL